jgi:predicted DNA-binding transcriptional regulator AlpA
MTDLKPTSPRGLNIAQVCARLGGSKPIDPSTLWRRIGKDPDFPKPFYLWDSAPRFVEAEIDAYLARRIAERDDPVRAAAQLERLRRREQRLGEARAQKATHRTRAMKAAAVAVKITRRTRPSRRDP